MVAPAGRSNVDGEKVLVNKEERHDLELGDDHWVRYVCWTPDRELNPQFEGLPDVEKYGAVVGHLTKDGEPHTGFVTFEGPTVLAIRERNGGKGSPMWQVESWDLLTLSPSLLCSCGDHGFIQGGKWVRA